MFTAILTQMASPRVILAIVFFKCIFSSCIASEQVLEPGWQRDVVKQMLNSTEEGRNYIRKNTIYNEDLCTWQEFACDLNMHVTMFMAWRSFVNLSIPDTIEKLTSLERLVIEGYDADRRNSIPSVIGNLTKLRALRLGTNLQGTIPSSLENLKELEDLSITSAGLTGTIPSGLGSDQPKLRRINLHYNELIGTIPNELVKLPFDSNSNYVNGSAMNIIDLSFNQLTGSVPHVIYESSVNFLWLHNNSLTVFEESIPRPPYLVSCAMNNNPFICPIPQWAIDECQATCTDYSTDNNNEGLQSTTIALIIASGSAVAVVIIAAVLFFVRRKKPRSNS